MKSRVNKLNMSGIWPGNFSQGCSVWSLDQTKQFCLVGQKTQNELKLIIDYNASKPESTYQLHIAIHAPSPFFATVSNNYEVSTSSGALREHDTFTRLIQIQETLSCRYLYKIDLEIRKEPYLAYTSTGYGFLFLDQSFRGIVLRGDTRIATLFTIIWGKCSITWLWKIERG